MTPAEVEDVLYLGCQARLLAEPAEGGSSDGASGADEQGPAPSADVRAVVIARAMRQPGGGDLCCPGPASPGAALAFGATPLEYLRHTGHKGTSPASARAGGQGWTDLQRGLIGWDGPPGIMTQVLAGAALAFRSRREERAALVFETAAAVESGAWHEGMNLAGALRVPLVVVLAGPAPPAGGDLGALGRAYGARAESARGRSLAELFERAGSARRRALAGRGPTIMEIPGYGDPDHWALLDDLRESALREGVLTAEKAVSIERAAAAGVEHARLRIGREPDAKPDDALAPVRTEAAAAVPWTRLPEPDPRREPRLRDGEHGAPHLVETGGPDAEPARQEHAHVP